MKVKYTAYNPVGKPLPMSFNADITTWRDLQIAFIEKAVNTGKVPRGRYVVAVGGEYKEFKELDDEDLIKAEIHVEMVASYSAYHNFRYDIYS